MACMEHNMSIAKSFSKKVIAAIQGGGIGVFPSDTLYGIMGSALIPETVEKIYRLRHRGEHKPMIILIADGSELKLFGVHPTAAQKNFYTRYWPGKVSVVLPCRTKKFVYLHRGTGAIAFRVPDKKQLRDFLKKTGPLVAPSANHEGEVPAKTIAEAKKYFGVLADVYVDAGILAGDPSTVVSFGRGKVKILRQGAVRIGE